MKKTNLFVYGTLRRGCSRHQILAKKLEHGVASYRGNAWVDGFDLYQLSDFPAAVPGSGKIYGEIYSVPFSLLTAQLDEVEGFPHLFDRKQIEVENEPCWIYFQPKPPEKSEKIDSGQWKPIPKDTNNG